MNISVEFKSADLEGFLFSFPQKVLQQAGARTLNRTAVSVRTEISKSIRETLRIKASDLNKSIEIQEKANPSQALSLQKARIVVLDKPQSLLYFGARQVRAGVSVNVKGKRKVVKGAFIAKMPNGGSGVFIRTKLLNPAVTTKRVGKNRSELPITKLYTTRTTDVFRDLRGRLVAVAEERMKKEFPNNFDFYLRKALKK